MDFNRSPILVFWETTRACLLSCKHCRAEAIETPLPGQLTTEEGMLLLDDLTRFNERPPVLILTGGDPFMREDIFDLAGYARSLGIPVGFSPSVTPKLTPENMKKLKDLEVRSISISLDGAKPATHDGVRGAPGHFHKTRAALEMLVAEGFTVQVNTTVMRDNMGELADIAAILADIGVNIWEVFLLIKVGRGEDVNELTPAEAEDVAHFLFDASRYGFIVRTVEAPFFRRVAAWRRELPPGVDVAEKFALGPVYRGLIAELQAKLGHPVTTPRAQTVGTRDGKGIVFISHDGSVYPAGFLPLSLGNVRAQSVVDIYRSHPLLKAIRAAEFSGRCGVCEYKDLCGGSRARAFASSHNPLGEDVACAYVPAAAG